MGRTVLIGIDVGSTTTKLAVVEQKSKEILFSDYRRHNANQAKSIYNALKMIREKFADDAIHIVLTGSGAKTLSEYLKVPYIQEVVANSIALKHDYGTVRTAIELGGQDAKMIFFGVDEKTGQLNVRDMRMNGSCAGGTGAFIDEVAAILKVPVENLNAMAAEGDCVYDISGRCGVFAKTDIQPLLNQGVSKENIALSSFHAIAKQTIGGLAQGLDIEKPVAFEGGPLTFHTVLVDVFKERLELAEEDCICPKRPEIMIAYGAALSLETMFDEEESKIEITEKIEQLEELQKHGASMASKGKVFFISEEQKAAFMKRQELKKIPSLLEDIKKEQAETAKAGDAKPEKRVVRAYLGIDSGSTTTKFVLMDEKENILDSFYAPNKGEPLDVAKEALINMRNSYREAGVELDILSVATTGYGELLFSKAFSTECHVVETVAHAKATGKYVKDATFILDIGGQDMKAIWIDHGIITNIVVNEACSSGCGSFLENFAASLKIPVKEIANTAFASESPAVLGSRCTVFMNSSIVTEQRNGKLPGDIMAGLCRSIIENVFTKVIRISNLESLGNKIVVQGGTFQNDAVLCAMEQYIGKQVVRAPYPGIMGAIGAALLAKEYDMENPGKKTFIGLDALENFTYTQESNVTCPFCMNHCKRSIVKFSNGQSWVTNNRCERGEILGDLKDENVKKALQKKNQERNRIPNLFKTREQLLFKEYDYELVSEKKNEVIGIPRVLSYWETMPFWSTFIRALGYDVKISDKSSRKMYENGLSAVTSDTVCFPAKLVHGHIRNLADRGVDRLFMPSITTVASENTEKTSESMCAVVKGYPIVIRNSDNPKKQWNLPFDAPLFHWYSDEDRNIQLSNYMERTFGVTEKETLAALKEADRAEAEFHRTLKEEGAKVIEEAKKNGTYVIVLASRPYQNDELVNHGLPQLFTEMGLPVITADSLPDTEKVDLSKSRLDVVNNYHARMLSSAIMAAQSPYLEYVQLVSFGCGHDAYLSDEIIRMMKEISGKIPLVLKLDESDVQGPLRIRVRSFVETVNMSRKKKKKLEPHELQDPYPVKFTTDSKKEKIVLVPNTSHAFSVIMASAMSRQGIRAVPLDIGRDEAIRLGKQYVHNDICFPAQIVIGEALAALKSGKYDGHHVAVGMGKYIGDCRLTHYSALLRKALDDAGFEDVSILTNDDVDYHNLHPGFKMSIASAVRLVYMLPMIDVYEELLRKIRPYELVAGSANKAFDEALAELDKGMREQGISGAKAGFKRGIEIMKKVKYDRSNPRPTVLIVGEYLLNFHPGANHDIENYLEENGFEIVEARMTDVIRKTYYYKDAQNKEYKIHTNLYNKLYCSVANWFFERAHDATDKIAVAHPLYKPAIRMPQLVKDSDPVIHHTFDAGEGVLIAGEIIHNAKKGCKAFVILQPFGCLPNHVVGRGVVKRLKEMYPDVQILPLDYDPDISFANVENRLQMLIMNAKAKELGE